MTPNACRDAPDSSAGDTPGASMSVIESVSRVLEWIGAPYAMIGGRAVAVRGHPRMTVDYDFLTTDARILQHEIWKPLEDAGATIDARQGDQDDPIAGVVHIAFPGGAEADVFLARWTWEGEVIDRAERLQVGYATVPVPRTSDLILLKLAAGGPIDLQDVVALLATDRESLIREVDALIDQVRPDVSAAWRRIRHATLER